MNQFLLYLCALQFFSAPVWAFPGEDENTVRLDRRDIEIRTVADADLAQTQYTPNKVYISKACERLTTVCDAWVSQLQLCPGNHYPTPGYPGPGYPDYPIYPPQYCWVQVCVRERTERIIQTADVRLDFDPKIAVARNGEERGFILSCGSVEQDHMFLTLKTPEPSIKIRRRFWRNNTFVIEQY